jgi:hypothetical protein
MSPRAPHSSPLFKPLLPPRPLALWGVPALALAPGLVRLAASTRVYPRCAHRCCGAGKSTSKQSNSSRFRRYCLRTGKQVSVCAHCCTHLFHGYEDRQADQIFTQRTPFHSHPRPIVPNFLNRPEAICRAIRLRLVVNASNVKVRAARRLRKELLIPAENASPGRCTSMGRRNRSQECTPLLGLVSLRCTLGKHHTKTCTRPHLSAIMTRPPSFAGTSTPT